MLITLLNDVAMRIMLLGMAAMGLIHFRLWQHGVLQPRLFGYRCLLRWCQVLRTEQWMGPPGLSLVLWHFGPCYRFSGTEDQRDLFHHDYACFCADAVLPFCQP